MPTPNPNGPIRSQYKAVVIACRCCSNRRRYVVTEEEAGYIEAHWIDGDAKLLFTAYDLASLHAPDGGRFSQSLNASDLSGLQVFPLSDAEVTALRSERETPITPKPVAQAQNRAREIGQAAQAKKTPKAPGLQQNPLTTLLKGTK